MRIRSGLSCGNWANTGHAAEPGKLPSMISGRPWTFSSAQFICAWRVLILLGCGVSSLALAGTPSSKYPGLQHDVQFTEYSPLAHSEALAQRLLTPLTSARLMHKAAASGAKVRDYPVDLKNEKYVLFVPPEKPPNGYALLVFVEPWAFAGVPRAWIPVLKKRGFIFVTAEHSGNTESVYERRIPLALIALYNVTKQYPIDPERIYIGGMSGGSRIAERMALAYPDLFRGALLHSSADPIGTAEVPLPNTELFRHFQESMRLVYITGQYDAPNIEKDEISRASMRDWCAFDIVTVPFAFAGHELVGESDLEHALTALEGHSPANPKLLSVCRDHKSAELATNLEDIQKLMTEGKGPAARSLLEKTDARFGGLAAPKSVELASQMKALE
jgi:hypothetical protein